MKLTRQYSSSPLEHGEGARNRCMKSRWETRCGGLDFTTAKIRRGRRTSPDTGVRADGGGGVVCPCKFSGEGEGEGEGEIALCIGLISSSEMTASVVPSTFRSGRSRRGGSFERPSVEALRVLVPGKES